MSFSLNGSFTAPMGEAFSIEIGEERQHDVIMCSISVQLSHAFCL